ncbi:anti-sigma regulatory factor [Streptomyces sp. TLI_171]|uniref:ATP-binding protein n=1 Tax=Streptomyces sp. TLI_171 TaxID=1938859 RepID=UPI000C1A1A19|nr:ATP-binding protein [Streptomyces sp. TLI_171]RKE20687.1 anti-sigma regulatory factor (Ser/Thr protein kinase) [Streptomyces sp. TLI_171]
MQVLQVQLAVQAEPAEVSRARRWVRARLQAGGIDPDSSIAETLVLVVSELVTNAVVHTGCPAVLRLVLPVDPVDAPVPVRVEVADASCTAPAPRHAGPDEDATNGRGLELVDLLCERWGWYPDGSGKRVWCEIGSTAGVCERAAQPVASVR